jgi:hypothetical protein
LAGSNRDEMSGPDGGPREHNNEPWWNLLDSQATIKCSKRNLAAYSTTFSNRVHPLNARLRHLAIETAEIHNPLYNPHKRYAISMFLSSVYQFPFESPYCLLCHKPCNDLAPVPNTICDAFRIITFIVYILK